MHRIIFLLFVFQFSLFTVHAQQQYCHLAPLHRNPILMKAAAQGQATRRPQSVVMDTLPFLDDFSKPGPYPDPSKWIDKKVYVNYSLPVCPHTLGVATFDGLDSIGKPYNPDAPPGTSDTADFLTSMPIHWNIPGWASTTSLANKLLASIYLSFYYQAGSYFGTDVYGRSSLGYWPKSTDTLQLQFRAGGSNTWHTVWYQTGYMPVPDTDTVFHLVMIPFTAADSAYLYDGFQFRFMNYACTSGDVDHWSIDEVYLNYNWTAADTMQPDLTFVYGAPSMLANYEAEPWEQYEPGDLRTTPMPMFERNNNASANKNPLSPNIIDAYYNYTINTSPDTTWYSGGAYDLYPYVDTGYNNFSYQADPPLLTDHFPASLTGATTYTITHYFQQSSDFDFWNDTVRFNQVFGNYYAYDDGQPGAAYFVQGNAGVPTYLAVQFTLNHPDTIFGLDIYFDYVFVNAENYTFKIVLWKDNGGSPGDTITTSVDTLINPIYYNEGKDVFTHYTFIKPVAVGAGTIYVGWEETIGDSMDVGIDFSNNHQNQTFYSVDFINGPWYNSPYPGSLMVRPLLGSPHGPASVNTINQPTGEISLYPNPSTGKFTVQSSDISGQLSVDVYNVLGEKVYSSIANRHQPTANSQMEIDLENQPDGFYLVQITDQKGETTFKKLLISR
ncbi:MAG: T9SS type A sorting domain-containing protein [Bacteroidia bacterium]